MSDLREAIQDKFAGEVAQGLRRDVSPREVDDLASLAEKVFEDRVKELKAAIERFDRSDEDGLDCDQRDMRMVLIVTAARKVVG